MTTGGVLRCSNVSAGSVVVVAWVVVVVVVECVVVTVLHTAAVAS